MARKLYMRSFLIPPAAHLVKETGASIDALMSRVNLPPEALTARESVLPLSSLEAFFHEAAKETGRQNLGILLANSLPHGHFGVIEYSCRTAPNVREALKRMATYIRLLNELVELQLVVDGEHGRFEQAVAGRPNCVGPQLNEFFVALVLRFASSLATDKYQIQELWFAHPQSPNVAILQEMARCTTIRFGMEKNAVVFDNKSLDVPLNSADPALHAILAEQAERALKDRGHASRFMARFRRALREALDKGAPTLPDLAQVMGLSSRSLQRRLSDEESSFQAELEGLRRELAKVHLQDSRLVLSEVAYLLGYNDLSAFIRAYKRWNGHTPAEHRKILEEQAVAGQPGA